MFNGLYKIIGGLDTEVARQESISRNLANSGLPGFKAQHVTDRMFNDELESAKRQQAYSTDFTQGQLVPTGRSLDFAINGNAFFTVTTPGGQDMYTRNGTFHLDDKGTLVTQEGHRLKGRLGPIQLAPGDSVDNIRISPAGELEMLTAEGVRNLGPLALVDIAERPDLERFSANYFHLTERLAPKPAADFTLYNKHREAANISPVQEMARMIQSLREFELGNQMVRMQAELAKDEQQRILT